MFTRQAKTVMSPSNPKTIIAAQLFDGVSQDARLDQVIEIADGHIVAVRPAGAQDARDNSCAAYEIVTPGFIDLQINGAADRQFNFDPTPETLACIAAGARVGGTALCLPTFITQEGQSYVAAIHAAAAAIAARTPGVLGLHLEGPFLSPARPGIHPADCIRPVGPEDLAHLTQEFAGPMLITLAPEEQAPGTVRALRGAGRIVFAGHSAARAEQMAQAEAEGLRGATHLFNAMSQMSVREPGVVGGVLASDTLFAGIIADGIHVAWPNVKVAIRSMPDRLCVVTDAMLTLAGQSTSFDLGGEHIHLSEGRLSNADGTLAGAHIAMDQSVANLVAHAGISLGQALQMASRNPADALGLGARLGRVKPGYRACLTGLDADIATTMVMVDGDLFTPRATA